MDENYSLRAKAPTAVLFESGSEMEQYRRMRAAHSSINFVVVHLRSTAIARLRGFFSFARRFKGLDSSCIAL